MKSGSVNDILFMMAFPFVAACILLLVRNDRVRAIVTEVSAAVIIVASIWVAFNYICGSPM